MRLYDPRSTSGVDGLRSMRRSGSGIPLRRDPFGAFAPSIGKIIETARLAGRSHRIPVSNGHSPAPAHRGYRLKETWCPFKET